MSANSVFSVLEMPQAKPQCSVCIRDITGKIVAPCLRHRRKYSGDGAVSLSADQLKSFLHAAQSAGPREYAMFLTLVLHGLRVSELTDLRLSDLDFQAGTIRIRAKKGGKETLEQMATINGFDERSALLAYVAVRPEVADTDPLFLSRKSKTQIQRMHRSYIDKIFVAIAQKVNLPAQFHHVHVLRHTLGQLMYDTMFSSGHVTESVIQAALRHQNPASTAVYAKPNQNQVHAVKHELLTRIL